MAKTISNSDDIFDSRDVIARIRELESYEYRECGGCGGLHPINADEYEELIALRALANEAAGYVADWDCGATLIRDSYFEDYARELAEDIGAINHDASWPNNHIDWEAAADALKMDYTAVDFDGVMYWVRS